MDKCTGIMGWIFGHSYRPVITKSAAKSVPPMEGSAYVAGKIIDMYRDETFHGIVCKRCGKVKP